MLTKDLAAFLRELLRERRLDYDVEVFLFDKFRITVLLHGDRDEWLADSHYVIPVLRYAEPAWRPDGAWVDYRFMAADALAA
jgi:hypothetical protein